MTKNGGSTWDFNHPIVIEKEEHKFIKFIIQDPFFKGCFLVETKNHGRYQGDWATGKLTLKEEKAMPHGYMVVKDGFEFVQWGENAEIFSFTNFENQMMDFVVDPSAPNQYFVAGMGKSPLKIVFADNRYAITFLNLRLFMTNTIDVSATNPLTLIVATPSEISITRDGGRNWSVVE
jgi:hypothetical protein